MGQSLGGSTPLGSEPPSGWSPRSAYSVQLTVSYDGAGNPVFSYSDPLFGETSSAGNGSPLDLGVVEDCIIILETDVSKGLYWSLTTDGLSLKNSGDSRYYFGLKYIERGIAFDRSGFPSGGKCSQICFGARLNVNDPARYRHPFNLDVMLERNGQAVPIRIDPDIQNPKV